MNETYRNQNSKKLFNSNEEEAPEIESQNKIEKIKSLADTVLEYANGYMIDTMLYEGFLGITSPEVLKNLEEVVIDLNYKKDKALGFANYGNGKINFDVEAFFHHIDPEDKLDFLTAQTILIYIIFHEFAHHIQENMIKNILNARFSNNFSWSEDTADFFAGYMFKQFSEDDETEVDIESFTKAIEILLIPEKETDFEGNFRSIRGHNMNSKRIEIAKEGFLNSRDYQAMVGFFRKSDH